jgi:Uma2 family endonuclease
MSTAAVPQSAPVWTDPRCGKLAPSHTSNGMPLTAADVWFRVGQVPLERILTDPAPGTATVDDAVFSREKFDVSCELVDGTLVAKAMGFFESQVQGALLYFIHLYLEKNPIGIAAGSDGPCETLPQQIRKPDVLFVSFDRLRAQEIAPKNVLPFTPDLAVEVLSPGNTTAEMEKKLNEYFATGARLVWYIESEIRTARVFTAVDQWEDLGPDGILRGGQVLPGFELALTKLFEKAGPRIEE